MNSIRKTIISFTSLPVPSIHLTFTSSLFNQPHSAMNTTDLLSAVSCHFGYSCDPPPPIHFWLFIQWVSPPHQNQLPGRQISRTFFLHHHHQSLDSTEGFPILYKASSPPQILPHHPPKMFSLSLYTWQLSFMFTQKKSLLMSLLCDVNAEKARK